MKETAQEFLDRIVEGRDPFVSPLPGHGKTVLVEFSSPDVAKHLAVHHLRSTAIGHSLVRIFQYLGYRTIGINFLGDWGQSLGQLMAAYRRWTPNLAETEDPLGKLHSLYVRYSLITTSDTQAIAEARECFQSLKNGDDEARGLWHLIRQTSLSDFQRIYDSLGVSFDEISGESEYQSRYKQVLRILEEKWLLDEKGGGVVVKLEREGLPPCLLKKDDGTVLHPTWDLAAAIDRWDRFRFDRCLYVAESHQALHFEQLFAVLKRAKLGWAERLEHVEYGQILLDEKGSRTLDGNRLLMKEVIQEIAERAGEQLKSQDLKESERIELSRKIGVGALLFHALQTPRQEDMSFNYDEMLDAQGSTGPYVQNIYGHVASLLEEKSERIGPSADASLLGEEEKSLLHLLSRFAQTLEDAARLAEPSLVSRHILQLAEATSAYLKRDLLFEGEPQRASARLKLLEGVRNILAKELYLLGLELP